MNKYLFWISLSLPAALIVTSMIIGKFSGIVVIAIIFSLLVCGYSYFEISGTGPKEIALIATLSAFSGVMRVPFVAIPGVQPSTFIIAVSGYVFGPYKGFIIGMNTAFISNMFLGQGPWTPWQMAGWGIVGFISGIIGRRRKKRIRTEIFALICFLYGFMFDWIMNLWHVLGYIRPLNIYTIIFAYLSGLTFDIFHAAGNFLFAMFFYDNIYKVLSRFKKRLEITYINERIRGGEK